MGQRNSAVLGFLGLDLVSPLYFEDHLLCFLDFWDQLSNGVWTNCTGRVMGVVSCTGLTGLNTNPTTWIAVFAPKISFFLWYCIKWERKCGGLVSLLVTVCSYAKTMWALRWNLNRFAQILFQSSGLQRWGWPAMFGRNWKFWGNKNLKDRWSSEEGGELWSRVMLEGVADDAWERGSCCGERIWWRMAWMIFNLFSSSSSIDTNLKAPSSLTIRVLWQVSAENSFYSRFMINPVPLAEIKVNFTHFPHLKKDWSET